MHRPPACAWTAGAAQWQRHLIASLFGFGLLASLGFGFSQGWGASTLLLAVSLLVCGTVAAIGRRGSASGQLRWDGEHWLWSGQIECAVTELTCAVDLQSLLLLRIRIERGDSHWLWLEGSGMDAGWRAMRRAVVASKAVERSANFNSLR
jgi:hypothetical protein